MLSKTMSAAGLAAALAAFAPAGPAGATSTINASALGTCTAVNCASDTIIGTLGSHGSYAFPWTIQVASDPGKCVRLHTTEVIGVPGLTLEMVVVSPSGRVFRGGGRNPGLVKISPSEQGFYQAAEIASDFGIAWLRPEFWVSGLTVGRDREGP